MYHVFLWWMHLEQAGNDIPYMDSFKTLEDAKVYCETHELPPHRQDEAQIFETLANGKLALVLSGYVEGNLSKPPAWIWIETRGEDQ